MVDILYLITELCVIGGAEKLMPQLLSHLDRDHFAPTVACLYGGDGPIGDEIRALGVPVVDLGMTAKWRVDALWRLFRLLRRQRPAILHASMFHANLVARLVGRLVGVPIILTWRHNVNIGGPVRELLNRWTGSLSTRIITVCELVRQVEIQRGHVPPHKVITIYNGIEPAELAADPSAGAYLRQSFGIPADALLLGSVGRMHRQKDYGNLLVAMAHIEVSEPPARLLLVGDGELRSELETQALELGLCNKVAFAGIRDDVPNILAALDGFVLSSQWEGLPLVVLEAMSAGLPIVATAVGGVPEVVEDGVTGLLVPAQDPAALAQAIITLLRDPDLRRRMGQAGKERVAQRFSVERMVEQLERLYEQLLIEKGITAPGGESR